MPRRPLVTAGTIVLLATAAGVAAPAAAGAKTIHHFREVEAGVRLSTADLRYEDTYRIKSSPWGEGSTIRDGALTATTFPATGTDTAKSFYRNGRLFAKETYSLAVPNVFGVGAVTGNGTCQSGTDSHAGETCTYTITGNYQMLTGLMHLTLTGTYTPAPAPKTKTKTKTKSKS